MKTLIIAVFGRTKDYKCAYVLPNGSLWKEIILPYFVREMSRSEIRCYLQSKFPGYNVKIVFFKQSSSMFIKINSVKN